MKRIFLLICLLAQVASAQQDPVGFQQCTVHGTPINLVTVDLNSDEIEVRPVLAPPGSSVSFDRLVQQGGNPYVAVTGTFFDPATATTVGNVVHKGRLMTEGSVGSVMTINEQGRASVRSLEGKMGRHINWAGTQFAVSAGPTLLTDGSVTISPYKEGFRDRGLYGARQRVAMGVTANNKLLLITTRHPVSLDNLARIFQELGAVDAVNLDGGSSSAMHYAGQTITRPGRRLTNLVAIYPKGEAPDQSKALSGQYAKAYSHYNKGVALFKRGDLNIAHSQVRKALAMAPDRAPYWKTLGEIQEQMKSPKAAANSYLKAAELYSERSQDDRAVECAELAFTLSPELRGASPLLARLKL